MDGLHGIISLELVMQTLNEERRKNLVARLFSDPIKFISDIFYPPKIIEALKPASCFDQNKYRDKLEFLKFVDLVRQESESNPAS